MSDIQSAWYMTMLIEEEKRDFERDRNLVEYMASFWNAEAVIKIKEQRDRIESEEFLGDEEFKEFVESGDFKNHPILDKLREKYSTTNLNADSKRRSARDVRLPEDKSSIRNILNKDFED